MELLCGRDLRKIYHPGQRNAVHALRGVDVEVLAGEMVAVVGPSGSGKSTLMHILGLLHTPDSADGARPLLMFEGRDVTRLADSQRTRLRATRIGFVFQTYNLIPTLTAHENVALAAEYAGASGASGRRSASDALALVGLQDRAGHLPAELSGGEQQRAAIARALVNQPTLVLCDEPTGNLDSARSREILALLRQFNRERGQTFVIVTHDPAVAGVCDRIVRMHDGRIQSDAAVAVGPRE
jgi:putative ABC transport system ATP-binding protein